MVSSIVMLLLSVVQVLRRFQAYSVKMNSNSEDEGTDEDTKEAIRGALTLYLDFINLFLMLLRIMGDRR